MVQSMLKKIIDDILKTEAEAEKKAREISLSSDLFLKKKREDFEKKNKAIFDDAIKRAEIKAKEEYDKTLNNAEVKALEFTRISEKNEQEAIDLIIEYIRK